jgi:hypothetical protein
MSGARRNNIGIILMPKDAAQPDQSTDVLYTVFECTVTARYARKYPFLPFFPVVEGASSGVKFDLAAAGIHPLVRHLAFTFSFKRKQA